MRIELHEITIKEIAKNYIDNAEEGVRGYDGLLNIRPKYQREFVYDENKRNAVIDTINKGFPLNVMYWAKNEDGTFEVLDGQQRTISFCQYVDGNFSINNRAFHNLTETEKQRILDYKCMVYFCEGNDLEKLEWFKIINIAGEKLTDQELRNAVYTGEWLTSAKLKFSKSGCAAYNLGKDYLTGDPKRQDYLETALKWKSGSKNNIEQYMSQHQHDPNANELWMYFLSIIEWVKNTFTTYRGKFMKGVEWGFLYNVYGTTTINTASVESEIAQLVLDDDVSDKKGIYWYVLTRDEKYLNIRTFSDSQKQSAYERQAGICPMCHNHFSITQMEGDHITPWHEGGKTNADNCQMLCKECNRRKGGI